MLNELKQLSQKVAKRMVVCVVMDIIMSRVTNENIDNFLNGQYINVKPNMRVNILLTKVLLTFVNDVESLVLAKDPIKMIANASKTITIITDIKREIIACRKSLKQLVNLPIVLRIWLLATGEKSLRLFYPIPMPKVV